MRNKLSILLFIFLTGFILVQPVQAECVDISSVPVGSMILSPPANIMLIFDDSGSMSAEFYTSTYGEEGRFKGRNFWQDRTPGEDDEDALKGDGNGDLRMYWKSQWAPFTNMYYEPSYEYEPWPLYGDADADEPKLDPRESNTVNLSHTFVSFDGVNIPYSHYYTFHDANGNGEYDTVTDTVYLVTIKSGAINYYAATITGSGIDERVTDLSLVSPPPDVAKDANGTDWEYAQQRQNFANYFSFYRSRLLATKAAFGNVIVSMQGVYMGLRSISNGSGDDDLRMEQTVLPVKVAGEDDETDTLLGVLYSCDSGGGTLLRRAIQSVGRYFDKDDNLEFDGSSGDDSPWASVAEGGECQQAFAVVMTDGYWNFHNINYHWPFVNRGDEDGDHNTAFDGSPYDDSDVGDDEYENTLADHVMYYYERDLANGLADKVPTNPKDSATHQHMVTYTLSFGVQGTLNPDDYDNNFKHKTTGALIEWPRVIFDGNNPTKIDDVYHAAANGRGVYLAASSSQELVSDLVDIMQNIESRIGSASSVSVNGDQLYGQVGSNILMFQSTYKPDTWTGDVRAYNVDTNSGEVLKESYLWSARQELDSKTWSTRAIATWDPIATKGREFLHNKLKVEEQALLNSDQVDFLRGDRSNEGGTFRNRFSVLGDIVHSSPIFDNGYLFVGANDGMMHCLDAATGEEVFAYVPNVVFENLAALTDSEYDSSHNYYVDLSPVITPGVECSGEDTITLLVGGLGAGGKGYYALDVSDPSAMTTDDAVADKVLWEYPIGSDDDLGYTFSKPTIVNSNDDDLNSDGTGWVVITGNGYNSANGNAVLFILDPFNGTVLKKIDTGVGSWNGLSTPIAIDVPHDDKSYDGKADYVYAGDLKGNLWKFDLTDEDYTKWGVAYGVDSNSNGSINYSEGDDPKPLFQTPNQPITTQPDVMVHCDRNGYIVIFGTGKYLGSSDLSDTTLQTIYGIWDYGDDDDNSEYLGSFTSGATPELSNQDDTVTLLEQEIVPSPETDPNYPNFWTVGGNKVRILTDNTPDWTTSSFEDDGMTCIGEGAGNESCDLNSPGIHPDPVANVGWYFDLPISGERVVSDVMIRENKVIVLSFMPEDTPCSSGGNTVIHEIDACTGGRLSTPQFDINGSGTISSGDRINIGTEQDPIWVAPSGLLRGGRLQPPAILSLDNEAGEEMKYYSSSTGNIETEKGPGVTLGIAHWREYW